MTQITFLLAFFLFALKTSSFHVQLRRSMQLHTNNNLLHTIIKGNTMFSSSPRSLHAKVNRLMIETNDSYSENDLDDDEDIEEVEVDLQEESDEEGITELEPDIGDSTVPLPPVSNQNIVETIIKSIVNQNKGYINRLKWIPGRIELVVTDNEQGEVSCFTATTLETIHREIYTELETRDEELAIVSKYEIVVASPGVSDILKTERDFNSFKGFPVIVSTKELFKKKLEHEGNLQGKLILLNLLFFVYSFINFNLLLFFNFFKVVLWILLVYHSREE